ncbi:hypothetical protein H4696_004981 [Amycolatopsis lexingtonensis]|uniref:Uncharacterized protein n=1 Tax=Amycolatopsis lexingtonensis TaxID=218822 RepID=A0ABR9I3U4_9PSEU|nr:hypothetical protein [Amycolatopsis lexingtonensis]
MNGSFMTSGEVNDSFMTCGRWPMWLLGLVFWSWTHPTPH